MNILYIIRIFCWVFNQDLVTSPEPLDWLLVTPSPSPDLHCTGIGRLKVNLAVHQNVPLTSKSENGGGEGQY